MASIRQPRVIGIVAVLVAAWIVGLALPPLLLLRHRAEWLAELDRPEAQERWDEFREAMRAQTGRQGPVQRKMPKSVEPPVRVWLRDHAWLAIAAWLVLGGTLGACTIMLVVGAAATGAIRGSAAEDQPRRDRDHDEQHEGDAENAEEGRHGEGPARQKRGGGDGRQDRTQPAPGPQD